VTDGEEETGHLEVGDLASDDILDLDAGQRATFPTTVGLDDFGVPNDLDLGVGERARLHDLGRPEGVAAVDDVHLRAVLGEEVGLLHGRVPASDDGDGLVPEDRRSPVADGAGGDAPVPEGVGAGEVQPARDGARGDDDGVGVHDGVVGCDPERAGGEVDGGDGLGEDLGPEPERLSAAAVHEFGAEDAVGEAREVLDVGGGGELSPRGDVVGEPALEEDGLELGARGVDGRRVRGRAAADDADARAQRARRGDSLLHPVGRRRRGGRRSGCGGGAGGGEGAGLPEQREELGAQAHQARRSDGGGGRRRRSRSLCSARWLQAGPKNGLERAGVRVVGVAGRLALTAPESEDFMRGVNECGHSTLLAERDTVVRPF